MASPQMSLKLLVDRKGPRVLFAEVPKEFVDFLFHIFSLPLGTLIELIGSSNMIGSLGKLKDSVESFPGNYLQPDIKLDDVLNPKTAFNGHTFLLSYDHHPSSEDPSGACKSVYRCLGSKKSVCYECRSRGIVKPCPYATMYANSTCPNCSGSMDVEMTLVDPANKEVVERKVKRKKRKRGYVKEVVTYMVMDNLEVKPMSTISSITLINKFGVKDLSQLEEKTVPFGEDEGLKLLKACLKTQKVLTTIFMH